MATITVNGDKRTLEKEVTVAELIANCGMNTTGLAVAVNDDIVSRGLHESRVIRDGDRVEIIRAIGGG